MTIDASRGFKRKTIIDIIKNKIEDWTRTLPKELAIKVKDDYILTGGAIASMLRGRGDLPNDFDIYFQTPEIAKEVTDYYLSRYVLTEKISRIESIIEGDRVRIIIKSAGVLGEDIDSSSYQYFEMMPVEEVEKFFKNQKWPKASDKPEYKPLNITSNAITLDGDIQIILRFVGSAETIHYNFDFVHATNYYTNDTGLVLNPQALECIFAKELKYNSSAYPVCAMFRLRKFIQRGWTITAGEMFKIAFDISKLDLTDYDVLQDQLTGVDQAYFQQILRILSTRTDDQDINRTYLFELVNRIFDEN